MDQHLVVAGYLVHDNKVLLIHHRKFDIWLPPGGHIEGGETLDQAIKREILEEVGIEIVLPQIVQIETARVNQMATPFHVNIHPVGDHNHSCLYYLCTAINPIVKVNERELKNYRWFTKEELSEAIVPVDVRNQALKALELYDSLRS